MYLLLLDLLKHFALSGIGVIGFWDSSSCLCNKCSWRVFDAGFKNPVGAVADNNPHAFADAINRVLELKNSQPDLQQKCHHQAENPSWSSTLMMMLRLHGAGREVTALHRNLRAA
jgi:hypothetical protein